MDPNAPAYPHPEALFESGKTQAMRAAEQLRSAAATTVEQFRTVAEERAERLREAAGEQSETIRDAAEKQWTEARGQVEDWQQELEAYVRANPTKSILATFGLGLVLGLLLRR